jgi:leucyl aminopeptidase
MTHLTYTESSLESSFDTVVVGLAADGSLSPTLKQIDTATSGWIGRLVESGQLLGKRGELSLIASPDPSLPTMILVIGTGDGELGRGAAFELASTAIRKLTDRARGTVLIALAECAADDAKDSVVSGAIFGMEGQALYQSDPAATMPEEILFSGIDSAIFQRGSNLGRAVNATRHLVNEPADVIYPESFADAAVKLGNEVGIAVEVWDEKKLLAEGCRAILAVGAGSAKPPRLVIMRHHGGGDEAPIAIVGKGVTFDSGGLSLKPSEGMVDMKCDMGGAATVFGVMRALAELDIKQNVIGFCGLAENMVSGTSYKLGDVIETRSGKTVEILNTDAEGRVVLADTLDVAIQHEPRAMVDLATLTGACMVALGNEVAGLMANDDELCATLIAAAKMEDEPVWQLPMFDLFDEKIKSKVADIKNVGEGRWGGAITAAKFLQQFVGDVPWVHIDIAGPAFTDSPKPHRDAGATGVMVRTLVRMIEEFPR